MNAHPIHGISRHGGSLRLHGVNVGLPQRLIIVRPHDLSWALKAAKLTDFILLAAGDEKDADAITLGERHGRALFILEERVKERLGLAVAPAIVRQVG